MDDNFISKTPAFSEMAGPVIHNFVSEKKLQCEQLAERIFEKKSKRFRFVKITTDFPKKIVIWIFYIYIFAMNRLTKQEQTVLCIVLGLLLAGWAVKVYRTAHAHSLLTQSESVPQKSSEADQ